MGKNTNKIEARKKKVLEAKLKKPTITERELAKTVKSSKGTIGRDLQSLGQDGAITEEQSIVAIRDADLEIVHLGQAVILQRFRDPVELEKMSTRDVSVVTKDSQVRYSFLAGSNSDLKGGEKVGGVTIINIPDNGRDGDRTTKGLSD